MSDDLGLRWVLLCHLSSCSECGCHVPYLLRKLQIASLLVVFQQRRLDRHIVVPAEAIVVTNGSRDPHGQPLAPRLCAGLTRSAETAVVMSAYGPLTRAPLSSSMAVGADRRGSSEQGTLLSPKPHPGRCWEGRAHPGLVTAKQVSETPFFRLPPHPRVSPGSSCASSPASTVSPALHGQQLRTRPRGARVLVCEHGRDRVSTGPLSSTSATASHSPCSGKDLLSAPTAADGSPGGGRQPLHSRAPEAAQPASF